VAIDLHIFLEPLIDSSKVDFNKIFELASVEYNDPIGAAIADCKIR
jgi:hypothetical protein